MSKLLQHYISQFVSLEELLFAPINFGIIVIISVYTYQFNCCCYFPIGSEKKKLLSPQCSLTNVVNLVKHYFSQNISIGKQIKQIQFCSFDSITFASIKRKSNSFTNSLFLFLLNIMTAECSNQSSKRATKDDGIFTIIYVRQPSQWMSFYDIPAACSCKIGIC